MLGRQDNWLITQHISRVIGGTETQLPQVSVLVEFQLIDCDINGCQRTFILNIWETSTADRNTPRKTANYRSFSVVAPDNATGIHVQNQTIELNFMNEEDGFYLGIRDQRSCFSLSCVIVFYHVCPEEVSDLVVHPETIAPPIGWQSPLIEFISECVPGAIPEKK